MGRVWTSGNESFVQVKKSITGARKHKRKLPRKRDSNVIYDVEARYYQEMDEGTINADGKPSYDNVNEFKRMLIDSGWDVRE